MSAQTQLKKATLGQCVIPDCDKAANVMSGVPAGVVGRFAFCSTHFYGLMDDPTVAPLYVAVESAFDALVTAVCAKYSEEFDWDYKALNATAGYFSAIEGEESQVPCKECDGEGTLFEYCTAQEPCGAEPDCPTCEGTGRVKKTEEES